LLYGIYIINIYIFKILGKRFAEMEMKLAFVEILTKFEVFPCDKTEIPLKYSNNVITLVPKHGIWLTFKKIN